MILYCVIGYTVFMRGFSLEIFSDHANEDNFFMGFVVFVMMNAIVIYIWPALWVASYMDQKKAKRLQR